MLETIDWFPISQTKSFPVGDYSLSAVGLGKFVFSGSQPLTYVTKHFSVFIQTDKAIYKADDTIHIRLIAIDSKTLPYKVIGPVTLTISDPSSIKIKQFSNVTFVNGKHENELLLSSAPKVGTWTISMEAEHEVNQMFLEYCALLKCVLPSDFLENSWSPGIHSACVLCDRVSPRPSSLYRRKSSNNSWRTIHVRTECQRKCSRHVFVIR